MPTVTATDLSMTNEADFSTGGGTNYESALQAALDDEGSEGDPLIVDLEGGCWNAGGQLQIGSWTALTNGSLYFSEEHGPNGQLDVISSPPYDRTRITNLNRDATGTPTDSHVTLQDLAINCNGQDQQHHNPAWGLVSGVSFFGVDNLTVQRVRIFDARTFGFYHMNGADALIEDLKIDWTSDLAENRDGFHVGGPWEGEARRIYVLNSGDDSFALEARFPDPAAGETDSNTAEFDALFQSFLTPAWMSGWHGGIITGTFEDFTAEGCHTFARFICPQSTVAHPVDAKLQNVTMRNFKVIGFQFNGMDFTAWDSGPDPIYENVTVDGLTFQVNGNYQGAKDVEPFHSLALITVRGKVVGTLAFKNVYRISQGDADANETTIDIRSTHDFDLLDVSGYTWSTHDDDAAELPARHIIVYDGGGSGGMPDDIDASGFLLSRLGDEKVNSAFLHINGDMPGTVDLRDGYSNNNYPILEMGVGATVGALELSGVTMHTDTGEAAFEIEGSPTILSGNENLMGTGGVTDDYTVSSLSIIGDSAAIPGGSFGYSASVAGTSSPPQSVAWFVDPDANQIPSGTIDQRTGLYEAPDDPATPNGHVVTLRAISLADGRVSNTKSVTIQEPAAVISCTLMAPALALL